MKPIFMFQLVWILFNYEFNEPLIAGTRANALQFNQRMRGKLKFSGPRGHVPGTLQIRFFAHFAINT